MLVENLSVPADPRVWREARTLQAAGLQVIVISPRGEKQDHTPYEYLEGIHIYRYQLPTSRGGAGGYLREYSLALLKTFILSLRVWRRHGLQALHAANPPDIFFLLGLFYHCAGKWFIFDQHDLLPEMWNIKFRGRFPGVQQLLYWCERQSYKTADIVITTNISQKQLACTRGRCTEEKVYVVRNGPEIQRFTDVVAPEPYLKQGKQFLLAYLGVMSIQDGVEYALQALHILVHQKHYHDVLLVLMGRGDQLPKLKHLAQDLQLEDYVHFTGWLTMRDVLRYLRVADIGVSPDPGNELNNRSTMLKTLDYMGMGVPVVAFDLPETRYSAGDAALYAQPNSVEEFADQIAILLEDEGLRHYVGRNGRQRVLHELCWEKTRRGLLEAYATLFPGRVNEID